MLRLCHDDLEASVHDLTRGIACYPNRGMRSLQGSLEAMVVVNAMLELASVSISVLISR